MVRLLSRGTPHAIAACRWVVLAIVLSMLAACSRPEPPEKERKPEPQAAAEWQPDWEAQSDSAETQADSPIERARQVEPEMEAAEERQRQAIKDSGG